jgi:hypothetical protein
MINNETISEPVEEQAESHICDFSVLTGKEYVIGGILFKEYKCSYKGCFFKKYKPA